ncbi:uncharacterized protein BT62DRAFT_254567 [Guyanagaster necrorhizus]|uniref:Uncharacterized protein n=1 Tax=Guyanagaster necrorhizus TaxID=856835 RepID=A0A9P8AQA1_9AGAR|nr:uncharacterized protein BT62DRAFT_254567 [Guyanagaster necrorhizus MCA 3950]KAG7444153.1 hypothetical protein BT62DRAFT_254567 [Guyanagaster necrorhizus MCA 3950]
MLPVPDRIPTLLGILILIHSPLRTGRQGECRAQPRCNNEAAKFPTLANKKKKLNPFPLCDRWCGFSTFISLGGLSDVCIVHRGIQANR